MIKSLNDRSRCRSDVSIINNPIALWVEFPLAMNANPVAVAMKMTTLVTHWHFGELMCGFKIEIFPKFEV